MTAIPAGPILHAIVASAVEVTAGTVGQLLMGDGDELVVVAASGGSDARARVGRRLAATGAAGLAVATGQPSAIQSPPGDTSNVGAGGLDGNPAGVLAAPCGDIDVVGVLEVARPEGTEPFTLDDVEEVTLLARIAGAALEELEEAGVDVAAPAELARELERLADRDPARYAAVARMIDAVLGQS